MSRLVSAARLKTDVVMLPVYNEFNISISY